MIFSVIFQIAWVHLRKSLFCVAFCKGKLTVLAKEAGRRQEEPLVAKAWDGVAQMAELHASPLCFSQMVGAGRDPLGKMPQHAYENSAQSKYLHVYLYYKMYIFT